MVGIVPIGLPSAALYSGGYRFPETNLQPTVCPRISAWALGGFAVMLGVLALVELDPAAGIDRPLYAGLLTEPVDPNELVDLVGSFEDVWSTVVHLPHQSW